VAKPGGGGAGGFPGGGLGGGSMGGAAGGLGGLGAGTLYLLNYRHISFFSRRFFFPPILLPNQTILSKPQTKLTKQTPKPKVVPPPLPPHPQLQRLVDISMVDASSGMGTLWFGKTDIGRGFKYLQGQFAIAKCTYILNCTEIEL
jgi:hypothetical protein